LQRPQPLVKQLLMSPIIDFPGSDRKGRGPCAPLPSSKRPIQVVGEALCPSQAGQSGTGMSDL
jgi:hypothetical protein